MQKFNELKKFITEQMTMSHVYQPVMLIELLKNNGTASVKQIAQSILNHDPTQIDYYSNIVKNMVGRVLTKNRSITSKVGDNYHLIGISDLTDEQRDELIQLCQQRLIDYEIKRGESIWDHRKRGHRPISGSIRYEVLKRAGFRCELCGISAEEKNLEVDHIHPKSLGGKDDLSNYQALCYSCNAAKGNKDNQDFRPLKSKYEHREDSCLFCKASSEREIIAENALAYAIRDGFPVTELHTLIIPKRHVEDYFGLSQAEINAVTKLVDKVREDILKDDKTVGGFNVGMNCGEIAGQTIFHCHVHLIPRRLGDVDNPRGGVRHVISGKGYY